MVLGFIILVFLLTGCVGSSGGSSVIDPLLQLWSRQSGNYNNVAVGLGVSSDDWGNSYVVGYTSAALPGQTQNGIEDYFIAKYNYNGALIWIRQLGASGGTTQATGVSVDTNGSIYITGYTNVGISGQIQNGISDYFIAKYDKNGLLLWTKQVGTIGGYTLGRGISVGINGSIYITGGTNIGISGETLKGLIDYFIAKYNYDGTLIWTRQVGGGDEEIIGGVIGYGISANDNGSIYITGSATVNISEQTQMGNSDYFIARYDSSGTRLWIRQVGNSDGTTVGRGISTDGDGNSYVTGSTDIDISGQIQNSNSDYFIAKYDNTGAMLWTRQVGNNISDESLTSGNGVSTDKNGNSYIIGYTSQGLLGQTQHGLHDYFIVKYDTSGNVLWATQVGSNGGYTEGHGISINRYGSIYVTGNTNVGILGYQAKPGDYMQYFIVKY